MIHLGVNIYHWGDEDQVRLLTDGLGPAARAARDKGLASRFWFTGFDARGPHVFALFSTSSQRKRQLVDHLSARLRAYLEAHPSSAELDPRELEERHTACRGKALCSVDREAGFAANDSFAIFDHDARGYPFHRTAGVAAEERLWEILDANVFWAIGELARKSTTVSAIRWLSAIDRSLGRSPASAERYWRYHASTLIMTLEERLATAEEEVLTSLPTAVGQRNMEVFKRFWEADDEELDTPVDGLLGIVLAADGRSLEHRWALLREVNHCTLTQLQQPVRLHIPLVLFAWHRSLSLPAAA